MNPSNRLLKASNLTNQRPEFLESYIRIFDSFDSSFIQKIRKIQLQLPALLGIVVDANPFDLVLQLAPPSTALENLFHLPLRLLVIDNRDR
jgi:hypothetical protein